ncbi:phosphotransferase [Oribacterium sp. FC2011]|uniref:phosphotransferase n=1 Tax=Oribacterium sp. FC2011 TaxID=1408311 RepID=UPI0004E0C2B9|nr:phosphotransferase [Oribacterium sp. FC2011]
MEATYEGEKVAIRLPEKIYIENAQEVEKEIFAIELPEDYENVVLDASELRYISSLGLRIILKYIKKVNNKVIIDNVSDDEVFKIFVETGFSKMVNVRRKPDFVDVTGLQVLGKGAIGKVYKLNDEQVLKVYSDGRSREILEEELETFREVFAIGIPTMIPFRIVETNEGYGFVFEFVKSDLLANRISENPEKIPDYSKDMADLMKYLGNTELDTEVMSSVSKVMERDFDGIECLVSEKDAELIRSFIRATPEKNTCVHGDLHAGNIMLMDEKMLLIDMDDFGFGHPVWDMAQLTAVYQELINEEEIFRKMFSLPDELPYDAFVKNICHMTSELASGLFDRLKTEYFAGLSEENKNKCLELTKIYCDIIALRYDYRTIRGIEVNEEVMRAKKEVAEYYLSDMKKHEIAELPELFSAWNEI